MILAVGIKVRERGIGKMKTKREDVEVAVDEEGAAKKQKLIEQSSSHLAFENPLFPLASYDDDEEDEEDNRRGRGGIEVANNGMEDGRNENNNDELDDEEEEDQGGHIKRNRTIEVRRDCPYLDTVNRQVITNYRLIVSMSIFCLGIIWNKYPWLLCLSFKVIVEMG